MVFAAASTTDAMEEIVQGFTSETGWAVQLNLASSGTLAKQIVNGAPAEVFLSANPKWMDVLAEKGLLTAETRRDLLANTLVLVAPAGREFEISLRAGVDLPGAFSGRLAVGEPATVPAGQYAKAALRSLGWWDALEDRLAPAADVRAALMLVERGEVGAGIVYATDAKIASGITVVAPFPEASYPAIRYPVARMRDADARAGKFLEFLSGETARSIFESHGFTVLDGG
jgi:molybdate transport system substrate-binding protein